MYNLMVFGYGGLWSLLKENIDFDKIRIVAFIDSKPVSKEKRFEGCPIITPNEIKNYNFDFIILASEHVDILKAQLDAENISENKLIVLRMNLMKDFKRIQESVNDQLAKLGNWEKFELFSKWNADSYYLCNVQSLARGRNVNFQWDSIDYIRLSTLELLANEINSNNILGNVAELGVYKGDFAKYLNELFSDRKLYLFDTFEGFNNEDVKFDVENGFSVVTTQFKDTDVESVIEKMSNPENIVIKKGYFPETANDVEEKYCFVSIDTDLFKPIYEGLCYFYPRLSIGGYIIIHDYNNAIFKGVNKAVKKFCSENNIPYVPISDSLGSVVISK